MPEVFHFKQFDIVHGQSAMKVGTDGVLLGAAVTLYPTDAEILDAGTGTGVIALMVAQRLAGRCERITGIDADALSAAEAALNFARSPWREKLSARHAALEAYCPQKPLSLIVSNPPYYDRSLEAPEARRSAARHAAGLSYETLADFAARHLADSGRLALILPADREKDLLRCGRSAGLYPQRILRIRTVPRKQPLRIIAEFGRDRSGSAEEQLLTLQANGQYTEEYIALTKDFYIRF